MKLGSLQLRLLRAVAERPVTGLSKGQMIVTDRRLADTLLKRGFIAIAPKPGLVYFVTDAGQAYLDGREP